MAVISIKNDMVLSYIEGLKEGTKVSVRELSAKLGVSEGTAYKAVKEAEALGLVTVKPKAGTFRVGASSDTLSEAVSAADAVRLLGLTVHSGKDSLGREIRRLVICDGTQESLLRQLEGTEPSECLCLCGDRPELQSAALEHGANLLLTGGARASWLLINLADKRGLLLLSSPQSAYSIVRLFDAQFASRRDFSGGVRAAAWMETPDYMYYNDVVADWQRFYRDSSLVKQYPIVDDNLELFGCLDIWKAATAVPSQKLRSVMADTAKIAAVSADDDLGSIARRFIQNGESIAAVLDGKRLLGIITANDLLRYYICAEAGSCERSADSFLTLDSSVSDGETAIFRVRAPASAVDNIGRFINDMILSAVELHMRELGLGDCRVRSGTFIQSAEVASPEGLMLVSRIEPGGGGMYFIEAELNDESTSYAKIIMTATATERESED